MLWVRACVAEEARETKQRYQWPRLARRAPEHKQKTRSVLIEVSFSTQKATEADRDGTRHVASLVGEPYQRTPWKWHPPVAIRFSQFHVAPRGRKNKRQKRG